MESNGIAVGILLLCLIITIFKSGTALDIDRDLLNRMRCVESGGNNCAAGDNGGSLGPYQITRAYHYDAVEHNSSLSDGGYTYNNVVGPGSVEYSERVISSYMDRYATPQRLRRRPTNEDIARIHNGGPNGYIKDSTIIYWIKVKASSGNCTTVEGSTEGVCDPTCSANNCMCFCCRDAGVCNCLTSAVFTPCVGNGSSTESSEATTATTTSHAEKVHYNIPLLSAFFFLPLINLSK